jgi:hypothetical protein
VKNIAGFTLSLLLALSSAAGAGAASPAPAGTAAASAVVAPAARAKEWLNRLQTGKIDRSQLTAAVSKGLTDALVAQLADKLGPLAAPLSMVEIEKHVVAQDTAYVYKVEFANDTTLYFIFALDTASGKISGLRFTNAE